MRGMSRPVALFVVSSLGVALPAAAAPAPTNPWREVAAASLRDGAPERSLAAGRTFVLDKTVMRDALSRAPLQFTDAARQAPLELELPWPDLGFGRFRIVESPMVAPELLAQYPELRTWAGQGIDDPTATLRLDMSAHGFHAMVLSARGTVFIDPWSRTDQSHYVSYFKRDYQRVTEEGEEPWRCLFDEQDPRDREGRDTGRRTEARDGYFVDAAHPANGTILRTYRVAVAATGEYTAFHGGTVSAGLNAIVVAINRVNTIYNRDLAVHLSLIGTNNLIVYTNGATDPYTNSDGGAMLCQNMGNLHNVIGDANFDIGHVFSTGGGGVAGLDVVCWGSAGSQNPSCGNGVPKARGVTGLPAPVGDPFYVDYVAHEMGHQFAGTHTFNSTSGSCGGGNRSASTAFEPGSGSTIQAYSGICSPENLQVNSDPFFHAGSLDQMIAAITNTAVDYAGSCPVSTATGNTAPTVTAGATAYIPIGTPFELMAAATDPNGDTITYSWEEMDLGPATNGSNDIDDGRPLFRSFPATTSPTRVFPKLADILSNTHVFGELLPNTNRVLKFRVTARDNRAGGGGVAGGDRNVVVTTAAGPFAITSQNTATSWTGGTTPTVTWNKANTDGPTLAVSMVDILLSTDGGATFPTTLASATANDGTHTITVPNVTTSTGRIKVRGTGQAFFDINNASITITPGTPPPTGCCDFNANGKADIVWRNQTTGENAFWFMNNTTVEGVSLFTTLGDVNWRIVGTADFNADTKPDVVWRNTATGENAVWYMNGATVTGLSFISTLADLNWHIVGTADFNADTKPDIAWRNVVTGDNAFWLMNGATVSSVAFTSALADVNWHIVAIGDFNADTKPDFVWRNFSTGQNAYWYMNGTTVAGSALISSLADMNWKIVGAGDFDYDAKPDLVWRNASTGENAYWYMNNASVKGVALFLTLADLNWKIVPSDY
jgi:hypothetical protein